MSTKHLPRKVFIDIDRSFTRFCGIFDKTSLIINPKNFLQKDLELIDYDRDSEDEF